MYCTYVELDSIRMTFHALPASAVTARPYFDYRTGAPLTSPMVLKLLCPWYTLVFVDTDDDSGRGAAVRGRGAACCAV